MKINFNTILLVALIIIIVKGDKLKNELRQWMDVAKTDPPTKRRPSKEEVINTVRSYFQVHPVDARSIALEERGGFSTVKRDQVVSDLMAQLPDLTTEEVIREVNMYVDAWKRAKYPHLRSIY